jgi:hypothetical protein
MMESGDVSTARGHWLTDRRLRLYSRVLLAVFVFHFLFAWLAPNLADLAARPGAVIRNDFAAFWTAGRLALEGHALEAYDPASMYAAEQSRIAGFDAELPWVYPPHFQLLVAPFAALPFLAAYFAWSLVTLGLLVFVLYRVAPASATPWLVLGFPTTYLTFTFGQNGFLTAALLAGALLCLGQRRDLTAGLLLGILTIKPQLGILIPFALLAAGRWHAITSAIVTLAVLVLASGLVLGWELWPAFVTALGPAASNLEAGVLPWKHLASPFASLASWGAPSIWAGAVQALLALGALAVTVVVWRRRDLTFEIKAAILASGTLISVPYLFSYDLMIHAVAMTFVAWDGHKRGWLRGERTALAILWLFPFVAAALALGTPVHMTPLGGLALFALALRRAWAASRLPAGE